MNKKRISFSPFRLGVIILTFTFALAFMGLLARLMDHSTYDPYQYSDFCRTLEKHDYPELEDMLYYNIARDLKPDQDLSEFEILIEYYHAAVLREGYAKTGDAEMAEAQDMILQNLEGQMTDANVLAGVRDIQERYELP